MFNGTDINQNDTFNDEQNFNEYPEVINPRLRSIFIPEPPSAKDWSFEDSNDTSSVGIGSMARSFSVPVLMSGPETEFNGTMPTIVYSTMPIASWVFTDNDDYTDDYDSEESDEDIAKINMRGSPNMQPLEAEALTDLEESTEPLDESGTTKKPIHKTTKKRKRNKKKKTNKKKRKTTKKHKAKSTKTQE